jgi:hypothetical protein
MKSRQCNLGSTATATALIASILLTTLNRGIHVKASARDAACARGGELTPLARAQEMAAKVDRLKGEVLQRGGRLAHIFAVESTPVVVGAWQPCASRGLCLAAVQIAH